MTVFFFFKNPERKQNAMTVKEKIAQIDILGAFFLICAIVCLLLALQWGGSVYPWSDSRVFGCLIGFGLFLAVFLCLQFKLGDRTDCTFDYSWEEVSTANWRKYCPWNDKTTHVIAVDTLSRNVDPSTGIVSASATSSLLGSTNGFSSYGQNA